MPMKRGIPKVRDCHHASRIQYWYGLHASFCGCLLLWRHTTSSTARQGIFRGIGWISANLYVFRRALSCLIVPPRLYGITLNKDLTLLQDIWFTGSLWIL